MSSKLAGRVFALLAFALCARGAASGQRPASVESPNGRLRVEFSLDAGGVPRYAVLLDGRPVLRPSRLGLVRDDADFSRGLRLLSVSRAEAVRDRYEILTAKRRLNDYRANRRVFRLRDAAGRRVEIIFQVSDDGAAFRYFFPGAGPPCAGSSRSPPRSTSRRARAPGCSRCRSPGAVGRRRLCPQCLRKV